MSEEIKTWRDFPEFYDNPFIREISKNEKWTVSDKTKRPIDMHALIHEEKVWGLAFNRGYNPMVDLATLCEIIPNAVNNAYFLDALTDNYVVLDIEPKCPDIIKQRLLNLPYLYGETSMSGEGYHLVFDLPRDILEHYPDAAKKLVLKETHGYYEILLNHMVTFTRNVLPEQETAEDLSAFRNIFELLASKEKAVEQADAVVVTDIDTDKIPHFDALMPTLKAQIYGRKPEDFYGDMSKYEFGITSFYNRKLCKLLEVYKDHDYTDEEKAVILYSLTSEKLPHREKHDQTRNNMPWLLYIASAVIAKSD